MNKIILTAVLALGAFPVRAVEVMAKVGEWMAKNGEAIYATRGGGIVKNTDGTETAKTLKDDVTYEITLKTNAYPDVKSVRHDRCGNE